MVMPGMSGRQLARELTALRRDLKVMFMSGYADESIDPGAVFLKKPFTPDALAAKIREALDGSR